MQPLVRDERTVVRTFDGYIPNPWMPCQLKARSNLEAGHHSKVGEFMKYQGDHGADTEVKCDGDAAHIHSVVVAAHSAYFRRTLMEEEPPITVDLRNSEINRQGLRKAIEFMYTGQVTITADSLFQTLRGTITLEISELQDILEAYLRQISAHPKCFVLSLNTAFKLAVSYQTRSHAVRLIARRFDTLHSLKDFSLLFLEPLLAVLSHPERRSRDRMEVFKAILRWISASPARMDHADKLMSLFPFQGITNHQKVECLFILNQCPKPIISAVLPRLKEADWHRTCLEIGGSNLAFSNLTEEDAEHMAYGTRKTAMLKEEECEREKQEARRKWEMSLEYQQGKLSEVERELDGADSNSGMEDIKSPEEQLSSASSVDFGTETAEWKKHGTKNDSGNQWLKQAGHLSDKKELKSRSMLRTVEYIPRWDDIALKIGSLFLLGEYL